MWNEVTHWIALWEAVTVRVASALAELIEVSNTRSSQLRRKLYESR
jgi:hypothetical protein